MFYTVQPGDTLIGIARQHGTDIETLLRLNPRYVADPDLIHPGDEIVLPMVDRFDPRMFGGVGDGTHDDTEALNRTRDAAHDAGWGTLYLPPGVWQTDGLSLVDGRSINIVGEGKASVLRANPGIGGAVLDFTGWEEPSNAVGKAIFRDFDIRGDGQPDPTRTRYGLNSSGAHAVAMSNISIADTGGPGWYSESAFLSTFTGMVVARPVDAGVNDVPYIYFKGPHNGDLFSAIGLRSITKDADGHAAWLIEDDGQYVSGQSTWSGCWAEFLHTPEHGAVADWVTNTCRIETFQGFDGSATPDGTTDTARLRLRGPVNGATTYYGGNYVWGVIPGWGTTPQSHAYGIDLVASRNAVTGVKGYRERNVRIREGVEFTSVHLLGRESGVYPEQAVVDESGNDTNTVLDQSSGMFSFNGVPRLSGVGDPNGRVHGEAGWTYQRTDGGSGSSFYVKESSATWNTDWVAK